MPFMYCDPPAAISHIRPATGDYHAASGLVTLASGTAFEIGPVEPRNNETDFVALLRSGDRVQMCYAPTQVWADAPPTARMAIAGNLRNGKYIYVLSYPKTAVKEPRP